MVQINQSLEHFDNNMTLSLSEINLDRIILRLRDSDAIQNSSYVGGQMRRVNELLSHRAESLTSNYFANFRNLINEARVSNTHDLGLIAFFEMLGEELIGIFDIIFSDPNLMGGLGIYICWSSPSKESLQELSSVGI